jgi:voltage-gated potassium channel
MKTHEHDAERLRRFARWSEWPLAILALLIIPSLLLDDPSRSASFHRTAEALNWVVWLAFCVELGVKAWLSADPRTFFRHAWFDLLIVLFSPPFFGPEYLGGLRAVRGFRLLRLLRMARVLAVAGIALESARDVLQHRKLHYVVLITTVVVSLGALSIYGAEHGQNPNIKSVGDAFWWSIVTATTVGYGDVSPITTEGRFIAVGLMLVGIGFISILTATMASFFFESENEARAAKATADRAAEAASIVARLVQLEEKQNELLVLVREQNALYVKLDKVPVPSRTPIVKPPGLTS